MPKGFAHAAFDQVAFDCRTVLLGNTGPEARLRQIVEIREDQQMIGRRFALSSIDPSVIRTATKMS